MRRRATVNAVRIMMVSFAFHGFFLGGGRAGLRCFGSWRRAAGVILTGFGHILSILVGEGGGGRRQGVPLRWMAGEEGEGGSQRRVRGHPQGVPLRWGIWVGR